MSTLANWSYTSKATHWARLGRDDWTRQASFGPPTVFACDYMAESRKAVDDRGEEFITREVIHTEKSDIRRGDFILIGLSAALDPAALADAHEVRAVTRYADTFENAADDYKAMT